MVVSPRSVRRQYDHQRRVIGSTRQVDLVVRQAGNTAYHSPCEMPSDLLYTHITNLQSSTLTISIFGMCGIEFFLHWFGFGSVSEKNSDPVRNEFGSTQFQSENHLNGCQIFGTFRFF